MRCAWVGMRYFLVSFEPESGLTIDRKSTRLNSSHLVISYAVFCLKKKKIKLLSFIYDLLLPSTLHTILSPSYPLNQSPALMSSPDHQARALPIQEHRQLLAAQHYT